MNNIETYTTKNYSIFKKAKGNREIDECNVRNIMKSVGKNGLKPTIIIVNDKMEIIDGQHRVEAFKRLGLPVMYQVHNSIEQKDFIALNTASKKWDFDDYVNCYAEMGYKDYIELRRLSHLYTKLSTRMILNIVNGDSGANVSVALKEGRLKLNKFGDDAEMKLAMVDELLSYLKNMRGRHESMSVVLSRVLDLPCVDTTRLFEQIRNYGNSFIDTIVDYKEALEKIEEVYNYKRKIKVRFVSEYNSKYVDKNI